MRLDRYDPAAINVEDQRQSPGVPETWWQIVARGVENNWNNRGFAGLVGLAKPAPARTLSGQTYDLSPLLGLAPLPQPDALLRQGLK